MRRATLRAHQLTVKQAKFVKAYIETGNGTQAALTAYETTDARTAHAIAAENLRKPAIAGQLYLALDCAGLTENRLAEAHAHLLEQVWSPDPALKRVGLRALELVYRIRGKFHPE